MAQLLYYLDGPLRISPEQAREIGLSYAFPDGGFAAGDFTGSGPGGHHGCVITAGDRCGYYPDKQTWLRIPDATFPGKLGAIKGVHVGFWNDARPTPAELQVARPLNGRAVRLRDGQDWLVPIARAWSDQEGNAGWCNALPGLVTLGDDGEFASGGVEPRYARLWEIATAWWQALLDHSPDAEGVIRFDFRGAHDAAAEALAANYRVRRAEIVLLGLFDNQFYSATEILNVLVDRDTFTAWAKKNLTPEGSGGSSTTVGGRGTTRVTGRR